MSSLILSAFFVQERKFIDEIGEGETVYVEEGLRVDESSVLSKTGKVR